MKSFCITSSELAQPFHLLFFHHIRWNRVAWVMFLDEGISIQLVPQVNELLIWEGFGTNVCQHVLRLDVLWHHLPILNLVP